MSGEPLTLRVTGRELEPYIRRGSTITLLPTPHLSDGEVGLFLWRERPLLRQFCEDSEGNRYLFTVNRKCKPDLRIPKGEPLYCFGKVQMAEVPLP